jgi:N-sulfoglucosamine sulfohydrolase
MIRLFWLTVLGMLGFGSLVGAERNIILIVTDDQSKTLGCYGDRIAQTPAMDAIAEEATIFTRAYATSASCSASRSVILTGTYNHANGQFGHAHHYHKFMTFYDLVALSLPNVLSRAGYRTGRIGKYHVAPEPVYAFDVVLPTHGDSGRNNVAMADTCEAFIKEKSDKPFFLYFATNDPHRGHLDDESCEDAFKPNLFGNLPNRGEYNGVEEVFYDAADVKSLPFLPDTLEARKELAQYYQSVARIDQGVARLVEILKEAGVYDKTLIVFTSDHGAAFPGAKTTVYEGGLQVPFVVRDPYGSKEKVYNDALINHADITPSILHFAGALDTEHNRPIPWVEAEELLKDKPYALAENRNGGISFDRYHGRSWYPLLGTHERGEQREFTHASHTFHEITMYYPMRVVIGRDYKLIWNLAHDLPYPFASDLWISSTWQAQMQQGGDAPYGKWTVSGYQHRPEFELFDLRVDPWEGTNLADDPAHSETLAHMKSLIRDFQQRTNDPWILKWNYE